MGNTTQIISPAGSLKYHSWAIWWGKNKNFVKSGLSILICAGVFIKMVFFAGIGVEASLASAAAVLVGVKKLFDTVDYWSSEVKINQ